MSQSGRVASNRGPSSPNPKNPLSLSASLCKMSFRPKTRFRNPSRSGRLGCTRFINPGVQAACGKTLRIAPQHDRQVDKIGSPRRRPQAHLVNDLPRLCRQPRFVCRSRGEESPSPYGPAVMRTCIPRRQSHTRERTLSSMESRSRVVTTVRRRWL